MQEYMGYCLIPTTKGQQMLFLVGKGGEGKSRVGLVMRALLGDNMNTGSIQKVEISPFARADLEHLLVMVDDDMKLEALPQTNHIKTIVTAELPLDLERKGKQSYQGWLFSRFMVFGNGTMKSLYDRSEGFFRRQLILSVRDKDKHREDDPFLAEKLCSEAEGILLWALEGLRRLIAQNYHFTVSERTKANRETAIKEGNNIVEFMESEGYFLFKADAQTTSKDFYAVYELWCSDNSEKPMAAKSFSNFLAQHEKEYNLEHNNKVRKLIKKRKPLCGCRCAGVVGNRKPVDAEILDGVKFSGEEVCTVGKVDSVCIGRQRFGIAHHPHGVQQIVDLLGNSYGHIGFDPI